MSILLRRISELEKENYNLYCTIEQCNGRIEELEAENARLREALELIAKSNLYFSRGEEDKQLSRVCEIARNALNGNEK